MTYTSSWFHSTTESRTSRRRSRMLPFISTHPSFYMVLLISQRKQNELHLAKTFIAFDYEVYSGM